MVGGRCLARLEQGGSQQVGELTLFLPLPQSSWPVKEEETTFPYSPAGAQVDPWSCVWKVTEGGMTQEDALCMLDFLLPVAQKYSTAAESKLILPPVWQPAQADEALLPEENLLVLPAEACQCPS